MFFQAGRGRLSGGLFHGLSRPPLLHRRTGSCTGRTAFASVQLRVLWRERHDTFFKVAGRSPPDSRVSPNARLMACSRPSGGSPTIGLPIHKSGPNFPRGQPASTPLHHHDSTRCASPHVSGAGLVGRRPDLPLADLCACRAEGRQRCHDDGHASDAGHQLGAGPADRRSALDLGEDEAAEGQEDRLRQHDGQVGAGPALGAAQRLQGVAARERAGRQGDAASSTSR